MQIYKSKYYDDVTYFYQILRKRRKSRKTVNDSKNAEKDKNNSLTLEYDDIIMSDVTMAASNNSGVHEEYDDVITQDSEAAVNKGNVYEYIHVEKNVLKPYNSLGPQDPVNVYEQIDGYPG